MADSKAESQKHNEAYADDPCFRLWKRRIKVIALAGLPKGKNRKEVTIATGRDARAAFAA